MQKINQIFKEHKWVIILALIAVIITAYPQVYFKHDHQLEYQGIEMMGASEKVPRIREVQDGYSTLSSPYLKEGKDGPYLNNLLGTNIIGSLGKALSLDLNGTILLSRFLFPLLLFLVIYSFVYFFSKNKLAALSASTVIFLGQMLMSPSGIWQILNNEASTGFLPFFRPVVSSLIALFFFSFLLSFWLFWEKKQYKYGILSAAILGLTFYDYFYTWTFLYAFLGVFCLILFLQKKWLDFKRVILVPLIGVVLAIPFFLNLYQASSHPNYADVSQRLGLFEGRTLVFGFLMPVVFVIFLLFFPRQWKERYYFALALLIAPFIALNQQIITGQMLQSGHYHWHFHIPLVAIFLLTIFFAQVSARRWEFFKRLAVVLIVIISIYTGIFVQHSSYLANEAEIVEQQKYGPLTDWFNENAERDEVVFANDEVSHFIVIYTPLNVFYHIGNGICSLAVSNERLFDALFSFYRMDGVDKSEAEEVFSRDKAEISHKVYGMYWRETTGTYEGMPDETAQTIVQKYQDSFSRSDSDFLNDIWNKYQVNYLIWDTKADPGWQSDQYSFLEKKTEINEFIIYQKN